MNLKKEGILVILDVKHESNTLPETVYEENGN